MTAKPKCEHLGWDPDAMHEDHVKSALGPMVKCDADATFEVEWENPRPEDENSILLCNDHLSFALQGEDVSEGRLRRLDGGQWWTDYANIILLTAHLADQGFGGNEIAYAVEKPWKHETEFIQAVRRE